MRQQAQLAAESADVILFLLDGQQGLTAEDYDVADYLRRCKKPLVLGVNKVDNSRMDEQVKYDYYCLGLGEPHTISAVQGPVSYTHLSCSRVSCSMIAPARGLAIISTRTSGSVAWTDT